MRTGWPRVLVSFCASASLLAGCSSGNEISARQRERTSGTTDTCARKPSAGLNGAGLNGVGLNVVGGELTNAYPMVERIFVHKNSGEEAACTASFYSATTLITAAHCLKDMREIVLESTGERSTKFLGNPAYRPLDEDGAALPASIDVYDHATVLDTQHDVGVVVFAAAQRQLVKLGPAPRNGDEVVIVGFGLNEQKDLHKRVGRNHVETIGKGVINLQPGSERAGDPARPAPGDSGGSLFDAKTGLALGVVSGGGEVRGGNEFEGHRGRSTVHYADLNDAAVKKFVLEAAQRLGGQAPAGFADEPQAASGAGAGTGTTPATRPSGDAVASGADDDDANDGARNGTGKGKACKARETPGDE